MTSGPREARDWTRRWRSRALAWKIPEIGLLIAIFLDPFIRAMVWSVALLWMGTACILNARRCGRRHCYLTGPFFVVMAVVVALHGSGVLSLGPRGWWWLGGVIVGGYGALRFLPERLWGEYVSRSTVQNTHYDNARHRP